MAEFNPSPQPGYDPNYIFWSRPAREQPQGDKSGQIALKGFGNLIQEGTQAADTYIKQSTTAKIHDIIDPERQQFTNALEGVDNLVKTPSTDGHSSLVDQSTEPVPAEVKNGVQSVQNLHAAQASGKINALHYQQKVIPLLQQLRSQNPGYRDYIDEEVRRIGGQELTANGYMRSLITDINQRAAKGQEESRKMQDMISSEAMRGVPQAAIWAQQLKAGKLTFTDLAGKIAKANAWRNQAEIDRVNHEKTEWAQKDQATAAASRATSVMDNEFSDHVDATLEGGNIQSWKDLHALQMDELAHPDKYTDAQRQQTARNMSAWLDAMHDKVAKTLSFPDADGRSVMDKMTPAAFEAQWKERAEQYQKWIDLFGKSETFAMGGMVSQAFKAQKQYDALSLMNSKTPVGDWMRRVGAIREVAGDQFVAGQATKFLGSPELTDSLINYTLPPITGMWGQTTEQNGGNPFTAGQAVEKAVKDNIKVPGVYKQYVKQIDLLTDPKAMDGLKLNIARAFFAPTAENRSLLDHFDDKSKFLIFSKLTSPDVSKAVRRLGDATILQQYQDTATVWMNALIAGHNGILSTLNEEEAMHHVKPSADIESKARQGVETQTELPLHYTWNSTHERIGLTPQAMSVIQRANPTGWRNDPVITSIDRLNTILHNMSFVAKATGQSVDAYLLKILQTRGIEPTNEQDAGVKIMNAVSNTVRSTNKEVATKPDEETSE